MSDLVWVAMALLLLVGIITAFQRLLRKTEVQGKNVQARNSGPRAKAYPAVGIRYNLLACKAVQKYYDQRFLAHNAPALPVPGCNVRPCPCRYIHYADRRAGEDRRAHYGIHRNLHAKAASERRRNDRRQMPEWA